MSREFFKVVVIFTVSALLLGSLASVSYAEKVTIRLATWAGVDEAKELQAILDQLNAKSNIYNIVQESSPAEYMTKLQTTLAAGTAADLFWVAQEYVMGLASKGVLMDITDRLRKDKENPAANLKDYFKPALDRFTYRGRIYGLPWISQPVVLFCNLDLFDKAGLPYPDATWDWDKFLEVARKLTIDKNGKSANESGFNPEATVQWGFSLNGWPPIQMFIWQAGGEVITPDFKYSPIDTPEAIKGAQFYVDLLNKYHVTPPLSIIRDRGFDGMYRNQQVAMFMGGAADDLDWNVKFRSQAFLVPKGPSGKRTTFSWIGGMAINPKTKYPDIAYKAFMDLTEAIHHWKIVPPRKSLATKAALIKINEKKAHSYDAIIASMSNAIGFRIFPNYAEWDSVFWNQYVDPLLNNRGSASELAPKVRPLLEKVLRSR